MLVETVELVAELVPCDDDTESDCAVALKTREELDRGAEPLPEVERESVLEADPIVVGDLGRTVVSACAADGEVVAAPDEEADPRDGLPDDWIDPDNAFESEYVLEPDRRVDKTEDAIEERDDDVPARMDDDAGDVPCTCVAVDTDEAALFAED